MEHKCIIVSAPSGAGKTTLLDYVLSRRQDIALSVSATTRTPRARERHGHDYFFLTKDEFQAHVVANKFIEWEEVYSGVSYGTLKDVVQEIWSSGRHALFDVDVDGASRLKAAFGHRARSFFVMPPSLEEIERRLLSRNTESQADLAKRMERAAYELAKSELFDNIIVNDRLEVACVEFETAICSFIG